MKEFVAHEVHSWGNVLEVATIAFAEVIQAGLAIVGNGKTKTWAFSVADREPLAAAALLGQGIAFGSSESLLAFAVEH